MIARCSTHALADYLSLALSNRDVLDKYYEEESIFWRAGTVEALQRAVEKLGCVNHG